MIVVLDTCALLYWTLDKKCLSPKAAGLIAKADRIAISSISIWEIGIKIARGKLAFPVPIAEYAEKLQRTDLFLIIPVDEQIWIKNLELDWKHKDPADRTIVATAIMNGAALITSDLEIRRFYLKTVW
jgi:PIN domain nuclease of toxin-antitoxin system